MNVLTQNGFKNFEAIIDQGEKSNLLEIMFDDKSNITCTYDHEFLLDDSYIPACFIEIGDVLSKKTVIDIKEKSNSEKVYDLYNVNDTHSYVTNGVISHNCNLLFLDEFAFVEDAATFYTSTYPVISSGKTSRVIITSTANGIGNQFHKIYEGALQSTNEFKPFRVDWWDVPGRDEEWKKQTISNTSELQFQQEFGNCLKSNSQITICINNSIAEITIGDLYECIQRGSTSGLSIDEEIRLSAIRWYHNRETYEAENGRS